MKLAIIVGHTEEAQGAIAVSPISQSEYRYNTSVAQVMYRYAKQMGLECRIFLRDGIGIAGAYKEVNEWALGENSVAIELHFNAFDGRVRGTETLCDDDPSDAIEYARLIQDAMCSVFKRQGKQNRGIKMKPARGGQSLKLCKIPSCLVEPFFADNPAESKLGHELMLEYAKCLVTASLEFLQSREPRIEIG